jgi:biopolymer transport protein ExbB
MNYFPSRFWTAARSALLFALVATILLSTPTLALAQGEGGEAARQAGLSQDNVFVHIIKSVGFFWIVLLPTSIWLIAVVVLLTLDLRMAAAIPDGFIDEFTDTVNKRKFKEAYEMARADSSFLGRVMTAGMSRLQYGLEDAREAAMNTLDGIKSDKEQKNNYTAVIGTLGPLLGLVGTVFGMIEAFMELSAGSNPQTAKLAAGIAHALSVTLVGIAISVPAIALNTYFRNRITQVTLDVGNVADDLLTQMYHNSKKPAAVSPTVSAATPGPTGPVAPVATAIPTAAPPAR